MRENAGLLPGNLDLEEMGATWPATTRSTRACCA